MSYEEKDTYLASHIHRVHQDDISILDAIYQTCYSVKRDLLQCQKRPTTVYVYTRPVTESKRTRPITESKETYYCVKRDLLQCQKRSTTVPRETYYSVCIHQTVPPEDRDIGQKS
jgi:hypothetical protein